MPDVTAKDSDVQAAQNRLAGQLAPNHSVIFLTKLISRSNLRSLHHQTNFKTQTKRSNHSTRSAVTLCVGSLVSSFFHNQKLQTFAVSRSEISAHFFYHPTTSKVKFAFLDHRQGLRSRSSTQVNRNHGFQR